jgi:hypothetical protein
MAQLRRDALATSLFVGLTYPAEFPAPDDHETYKNHLRVLFQRLVREQGRGLAGYWKLEFQERGAAHYHILLTGFTGDIYTFRKWLKETWYQVVGSGDAFHRDAGTSADPAKSVHGAMSYLAKYIAKNDQTRPGNFTGRYWGKFNRVALPLSETETLDIEEPADVHKISRWMRRIIEGHMMESWWKRALEKSYLQPDAGWSRLAAERALAGQLVVTTTRRDSTGRSTSGATEFIPAGTVVTHQLIGAGGIIKLPPRFRLRGRGSVRLIGDVQAFRGAIMRAQAQGILSRSSKQELIPTPALCRAISPGGDPAIVFGSFRMVSRQWGDTPKRISGEDALTDCPEECTSVPSGY